MQPTPYEDVNKILHLLKQELINILGGNLIGLYLAGSLSYGEFNSDSSDIDLVAVINNFLPEETLALLKKLHQEIEMNNKKWAKRIECSYVPLEMLQNILPPKSPRPYIGKGIFYSEALYGNEWLINNYLLYNHGIALIGPDFKTLVKPINIVDVQKASIADLFAEWQPKITDPEYLKNSHYQSYVVLNLCRILYTVLCAETASKKVSAAWVKKEYPQWTHLIETAENWKYGTEMNLSKETIEFIRFSIATVNKLLVH